MKRSDMIKLICKSFPKYGDTYIANDVADEILTLVENEGMMPPFRPYKTPESNGNNFTYGEYTWESEDNYCGAV